MIPIPQRPKRSSKAIPSASPELIAWGAEVDRFMDSAVETMKVMQSELAQFRSMISGGQQPTTAKQSLVFSKGAFTPGNLVAAVDASGKILQDGGAASTNAVTGPGSATVGDVAVFNNVNGRVLSDTGVVAANLVAGPASATDGDLAAYNGATGKLIKDSSVPMAWLDQSVATTGTPQLTRLGVGAAADGTVKFALNDAVTGPAATVAIPAPNSYYGSSDSAMLGEPNVWLRMKVGASTVKIPCYT